MTLMPPAHSVTLASKATGMVIRKFSSVVNLSVFR
jgi:hypothetical protein